MAITYRNLLLTMLLGGLWHGAGWTFVAWGLIHGVGLCVERFWRERHGTKPEESFTGWDFYWRRLATFHVVCFAWIFFRSDTFEVAWQMITGLFTRWGEASPLVTGPRAPGDRRRDRLAVPAAARDRARFWPASRA